MRDSNSEALRSDRLCLDSHKEYPGNLSQYHGNQKEYPGNWTQYPGNQKQYPGKRAQYHDSQTQYPSNQKQHPDNKTHCPSYQTQYPGGVVKRIQDAIIQDIIISHRQTIRLIILSVTFLAYCAYLGFAVRYSLSGAYQLVNLTALVTAVLVYIWIKRHFGGWIFHNWCLPTAAWIHKYWNRFKW